MVTWFTFYSLNGWVNFPGQNGCKENTPAALHPKELSITENNPQLLPECCIDARLVYILSITGGHDNDRKVFAEMWAILSMVLREMRPSGHGVVQKTFVLEHCLSVTLPKGTICVKPLQSVDFVPFITIPLIALWCMFLVKLNYKTTVSSVP